MQTLRSWKARFAPVRRDRGRGGWIAPTAHLLVEDRRKGGSKKGEERKVSPDKDGGPGGSFRNGSLPEEQRAVEDNIEFQSWLFEK